MASGRDLYDEVAYPGSAYSATHPDGLAVMARLHGMEPAAVDRCRVLEIGCGDGANLIPMAYAMPGSEFTGFDLAAQPIARGQRRIDALGLRNIRLFQGDLMQVGGGLGQFDFIVAHGVYAWVPQAVRDGLLALCREHLAPQGVAFISYNALPGGHLRMLVGEILKQGAAGATSLALEPQRALEFLQMVTAARGKDEPLRGLLEQYSESLQKRGAGVFYHDEMAPAMQPVSFQEFVIHASSHKLKYLSEAVMPVPSDPCFKPEIAALAESMAAGDPIAEDQIYDYFRMRKYRETLLCHAEVSVSRALDMAALGSLRLASRAVSSQGEAPEVRVFALRGNIRMKTAHASTIALMDCLIEAWPESVPFSRVNEFLEERCIVLDAEVMALILRLVVARMIDLHAWAHPVSRRIGERPRASAVTRNEARSENVVTTLSHESLSVTDPALRELLPLLDGTRDRADLLQMLKDRLPETPVESLAEGIEPALRVLNRESVLLADGFAR